MSQLSLPFMTDDSEPVQGERPEEGLGRVGWLAVAGPEKYVWTDSETNATLGLVLAESKWSKHHRWQRAGEARIYERQTKSSEADRHWSGR